MSTTVTVSNSVQLVAALKAAAHATTPETILLDPGTYSKVVMVNYNPTANITVESASSSNKAVVDGLILSYGSNFTFQNLKFANPSSQPTAEIAQVYASKNVTFNGDQFSGQPSTSWVGSPFEALSARLSTNTTITNSSFQYVENGIGQSDNNGITISNNSFTDMFGDGIDNAGSSNVNILSNSFTNMAYDKNAPEHPDCIQFWTTGQTTAGSNITISGNSYNLGSGNPTQGIFITDQVGDLQYKNVTIENNNFVGTAWDGISLQHVSNALVENNTLQSVISTGQLSRITLFGGVSGLIENNKIGQFVNEGVNTATVTGDTILPAISASAAQALASSIASLASSAAASVTASQPQLAANAASGGAISIPRA